jgi:CheY-like chemotaxis protein
MPDDKRSVLIVDEDALLAEITAFRLELLGFEVNCASTGEAALARMGLELPGLLVIGNTLSDMDGLELLNRLSNDVNMGSVPAIYMSTNADLEDVQKAFNAGADEYLVIPFDPFVLEQKIERAVQRHTVRN